MKRCLLLLLLFLANSVFATSISYLPFSKMLIGCKNYYICRYIRTEGRNVLLADRLSGKEFVVSGENNDNPAGDSYLVLENEKDTFLVRQYPYSKKNDRIVAQLSSRIRDINKMPDSEEKFRTCKEWIFSLMDVPFLRWYGFYEWESNEIIHSYRKAQKALKEAGKISSFKMLSPKEDKKFYKAFMAYKWPDFYTWDVVWLLDDKYNDELVRYVSRFLEWSVSEDAENFSSTDGSRHSICEFCGVHVLEAAGLGGKEFLKIVEEYHKAKRNSYEETELYFRRMVEALKKQFSR